MNVYESTKFANLKKEKVMSRQITQANMDFCVLNAQSVCAFARVNAKEYAQALVNSAYTTLSTLRGGGRTLISTGFQPATGRRR